MKFIVVHKLYILMIYPRLSASM